MRRRTTRLGDYLRARRAVTQPEEVGLVRDTSRRVNGLRREEVAQLAGISPDYYLRLEQGKANQPSEQVVASLVTAFQLDRHGELYLRRLAIVRDDRSWTAAGPLGAAEATLVSQIRGIGAWAVDTNLDIVQCNAIGVALMPNVLSGTTNLIAEVVRSPSPAIEDRSAVVDHLAALLRFIGAPNPRRQRIIEDLSQESPEFAASWAKHDVREPGPFSSRVHMESLGKVTLEFNMLLLASGEHGVVTVAGSDNARGRALMSYLEELGDEVLRTGEPESVASQT